MEASSWDAPPPNVMIEDSPDGAATKLVMRRLMDGKDCHEGKRNAGMDCGARVENKAHRYGHRGQSGGRVVDMASLPRCVSTLRWLTAIPR